MPQPSPTTTPLTPLTLEDISVGQRFTTASYTMDEEEIKAFARQFDPQPFHLDAEAARGTVFGGLVASGWHTASITMKLIVTTGIPIANGLIGMSGEITWPNPVQPGDTLRAEGEVLDVVPSRSRPDRGVVTTRIQTLNQKDEAVQIMVTKLLVFRRKQG